MDTKYKLFLTTAVLVMSAVFSFNASAQTCEAEIVQNNGCGLVGSVEVTFSGIANNNVEITLTNQSTFDEINVSVSSPPPETIPVPIAGEYEVSITNDDGQSCIVSPTIEVLDQPLAVSFPLEYIQPSCSTSTGTGSISISAVSPTDEILFELYDGDPSLGATLLDNYTSTVFSASASFTDLDVGTYYIQVSEGSGLCPPLLTGPHDVGFVLASNGDPAYIDTASGGVTHVACYGESTGGAAPTVFAIGITETIETTKWYGPSGFITDGLGSVPLVNQPAGMYTMVVSETNGCDAIFEFIIEEPDAPLSLNLDSQIDAECFGEAIGSLTVQASGGTPPYEFSLDGVSYEPNPGNETSWIFDNLLGDITYTVYVKDDNDCVEQVSVYLDENDEIVVDMMNDLVVTQPLCYGDLGQIEVTATGGEGILNYDINGDINQTGIFSLGNGSYDIIITDELECSFQITDVNVVEPEDISVNTLSESDVSCNGGSDGALEVEINGGTPAPGYTWQWNGPNGFNNTTDLEFSEVIGSGLQPGSYTLDIWDSQSCFHQETLIIDEPDMLQLDSIFGINVDCFGESTGELVVSASGGVGSYGFSLDGISYQLDGSSYTFDGLEAGTNQTFYVRDDNLCVATLEATISENSDIFVDPADISVTHAPCNGDLGTIDIEASGGNGSGIYFYSIDGGVTTQNTGVFSDVAGGYVVLVTDNLGCEHTEPVVITEPGVLTISEVLPTEAVLCHGESTGEIEVMSSGGTMPYSFQIGAEDFVSSPDEYSVFNNLSANTYEITVEDAKTCTETISVVLGENPDIDVDPPLVIDAICSDTYGSFTISASGGVGPDYSYSSNGQTNLDGQFDFLLPNTYQVEIVDMVGCIHIEEDIVINSPDPILATLLAIEGVSCSGNSDGLITVELSGGTPGYTWEWLGPNGYSNTTDLSIDGLEGGLYSLIVSDFEGCATAPFQFTISEPDVLELVLTNLTNVDCFGESTGNVEVEATGGTGPFAFSVNGEASQISASEFWSLNDTVAGTYDFNVVDFNTCTSSLTVEILENPDILVEISITPETCNSDNGAIDIITSGGVGPTYTYSWTSGSTLDPWYNNLAGDFPYFLTVIDEVNCTHEETIFVPEIEVPEIVDIQVENVLCNNTATGSIVVDVDFGSPLFTYTWTLPGGGTVVENDSILESAVAGTYGLTVTDANSCVVVNTIPIIVDEPNELVTTIDFLATTDTLNCNGDIDGEIHFNTVGGTPFEGGFYWVFVNDPDFSEQLVTNSLYGLSVGVYDIAIVDSNGCVENVQHEILEPDVLTTHVSSITSPLCHGDNNGNVDIVISGGTADFSFTNITPFSNFTELSADTFRIYGLTEGVYYYDIIDEKGCASLNNSFYVSEPLALEINSIYSTPESCVQWDGTATSEIVGGISPYVYNWTYDEDGTLPVLLSDGLTPNPNNLSSTVDFLTSGTYYSHIIDYNGCTTYGSVEVLELSGPELSVVDVVHNDCFGDAEGQISVSTAGGNPLYQYSIDGGVNWYYNTVFTDLSAGLYTITVRDDLDCSDVFTEIEVLEPTPVVATSSTIDVSCFGDTDGSATLNATGGTSISGGYSFVWQLPNGTNLFPSNLSGLSQTVNNLAPGSYQVEVTDDNGCFTLHAPVVINEPQLIGVAAEVTSSFNNQQISCYGSEDGSLQAVGSGGTGLYTFDWFYLGNLLSSNTAPSLSVIDGLSAGEYGVDISDENGCTASTSVSILSPDEVMVSFEDVIHIRCEGEGEGQATAAPSGGISGFYNYIWTNSSNDTISLTQQAQSLVMGEYFVTVSDVNECFAIDSIIINDSEVFQTLGPDTVSVNCFGIPDGIADLNPTGGWLPYSHLWSDPLGQITQEATGLVAGQWYVDIIYDANGCLIVDSVYVDGPESYVSIDAIIASDALCFDESSGSIDLTIVGGTAPYTYNWEGPDSYSSTQANLTNVSAGTYHVTITDSLGCENYTFTTVGQPPTPVQITNVNTTNVQCYGEANGTAIIPNSSIVGGVAPYNTVDWQGENPNSLEAGVYSVTVEDSHGCEGSFTYEIFEPTALTAVITDVVDEECTGGDATIIVDAQGGVAPYSYMYENDFITQNSSSQNLQIDFDPINEGNDTLVTITVTDDNGCEFIIEDVEVHPAHIFNHNASITVCEGTPVDLNAAIPVNYQSYAWTVMGQYSSESTVQFDATVSTIVTVDVVTADGCTFSDEIAVNVNYPIVDAGIDNGIIVGESVTLEATAGMAVVWLTPDTILQSSVEVSPLRTTQYYAAILDESNMCVGVDSVRVFVGMNEGFSPNGDGFNDTWEVSYLNQFGDLKIEVFNRWGMLLWSSQSPMIANWDGTYNGKDMPVGTYYYVITFNSEDKDPLTGPVTIVR